MRLLLFKHGMAWHVDQIYIKIFWKQIWHHLLCCLMMDSKTKVITLRCAVEYQIEWGNEPGLSISFCFALVYADVDATIWFIESTAFDGHPVSTDNGTEIMVKVRNYYENENTHTSPTWKRQSFENKERAAINFCGIRFYCSWNYVCDTANWFGRFVQPGGKANNLIWFLSLRFRSRCPVAEQLITIRMLSCHVATAFFLMVSCSSTLKIKLFFILLTSAVWARMIYFLRNFSMLRIGEDQNYS